MTGMKGRRNKAVKLMHDLTLGTVIRAHVEKMLKRYGPEKAARVLGIGRSTLQRYRRKWKLPVYRYMPKKRDS